MPTGVNITEFGLQFYNNVIDHIDYIYTDGSRQTASSVDTMPKAIRQMKVYFKNGIQSDELTDINQYSSEIKLSFDTAYPDGTPIKNFDTFKITGSFSCDELGSTDNVDVAQIMLAPTQKLTDQMLTDTSQAESNTAPNASGNFINATIRNDGSQHQGHLTNPIFYFKYNNLMVPDLSEISASYDNQNKELGSIGLTNIDNNKIHSSIITDNAGQKFIKVQVDGEYYYGDSFKRKSGFNVKIPIINASDALSATKDWSWYILNNSDEAKTESTIQGNKLSPVTVDGNTLSVGGTGTWQIRVAQSFVSSTETQGNLNGGPGLVSTQDVHRQDPTYFNIYNSIINATNDAKSDLVSVTNLPSTQDGKSQFDVHMTGKASLINVMTGQAYDATITYSYGIGDNNFITSDQVTDWSKVKSIKVVPNGGSPSMTSLRLVVPVEDKTVYDDVGKTIYISTMTYGEDKTNTNYTAKDGFAVPEKSTILPTIIKAGDTASSKLTVQGQATVHTLIHYKDASGKDVYVKLADQDKTYNELQDTMKRSDYLQSDRDLTIADRGLLPVGMIINYNNPTIHNSNNTYVANYANNAAAFDKPVKYDFDGDQVIFEGAMPEIVTKTHQAKETIHYVYSDDRPAKPDKVLTSITLKQTGSKNPFTGEITWNTPITDTLNSVDSPEITGYIADKLTVPSYVVTMDSPDKEVTVTYYADNENADFTYFDDTTNSTLNTVKKSGKSNTSIGYTTTDDINNYEKQGYTLVSDETNGRNLNFDSLTAIDQHYTIHFKHRIDVVSHNQFVKAGTLVDELNPNGARNGTGMDKADLNQVATRKIHVTIPNNYEPGDDFLHQAGVKRNSENSFTITQIIGYMRDGLRDAVTGKLVGYRYTNGENATDIMLDSDAYKTNQGWMLDVANSTLGTYITKNGVVFFKQVKLPKINGYSWHIEKKQTVDNFNNVSHMFTRYLVNFVALPVPRHNPQVVKSDTGLVEQSVKPANTQNKPAIEKPKNPIVSENTVVEAKPDTSTLPNNRHTPTSPAIISQVNNATATDNHGNIWQVHDVNVSQQNTAQQNTAQQNVEQQTPGKTNKPGDSTPKTPGKSNKPGNSTPKTSGKSNKSGKEVSKTSEKPNNSGKEVSKQRGTIAETTIPETHVDSRAVNNQVSTKLTAKRELPQTGATTSAGVWVGLASMIASLGLLGASKKRKKN